MRGRAGLSGRCGSRMGGPFAPGRLVGNARGRDDSREAVGRAGTPAGFPVCNAASATAELQPTVVAASRPTTGVPCLLKGKALVFSYDKMPNEGLLAGTLAC